MWGVRPTPAPNRLISRGSGTAVACRPRLGRERDEVVDEVFVQNRRDFGILELGEVAEEYGRLVDIGSQVSSTQLIGVARPEEEVTGAGVRSRRLPTIS